MGAISTPNLDLLRIQETWQFSDEAFNDFIDDADNKLVGVAHLNSPKHWVDWKPETDYAKDDIVRTTNTKSHQYYQCIYAGTSGVEEPTNNVTGSILADGTVTWKVVSLSEADVAGGALQIWLSGGYYTKGDAVIYGTALYRCKVDHTARDWLSDYIYWQEVCASVRMWQPVIYYFVDDVVVVNSLIYKCILAHRSAATFNATEEEKWELIGGAGGAGDWAADKTYQEGHLVIVNDILYRANQKHTSSSSFRTDIAKWDIVNANIKDWEDQVYYPEGTLVNYQGVVYKCITAHTATTDFYTDRVNWILFHNPIVSWQSDNYYEAGQIAIYNDCLYRCNTSHSTFSETVNLFPTKWVANKNYIVGDSVVFADNSAEKLYVCQTAHTSTDFLEDVANWDFVKDLSGWQTTWLPNNTYSSGDIIQYGGLNFDCISYHISSNSFLDDLPNWGTETVIVDSFERNHTKWDVLYTNIQTWQQGKYYKVNSIVLYDDMLFRCIQGHQSNVFFAEIDKWKQLDKLDAVVADWRTNTRYGQYQCVLHDGRLLRCNSDHTSSETSILDDSGYWDVVYASLADWKSNTLYKVGDTVVYDNKLYKCIKDHISGTLGVNDEVAYSYTGGAYQMSSVSYTHTIDLDSIMQVKEVSMVLYRHNNYAGTTKIECTISVDGINFISIGEYSSQNSYMLPGTYSFNKAIEARYIRFNITNAGGALSQGMIYIGGFSVIVNPENFVLLGNTLSDIISNWSASTLYYTDNMVLHDNCLYRCIGNHYSTTFDQDIQYWQPISSNLLVWAAGRAYNVGDTVVYRDMLYQCITANNSSTFVGTEWKLLNKLEATVTNWQPSTSYLETQLVLNNNTLYRCNTAHISSASSFIADHAKWDIVNASICEWGVGKEFVVGNLVLHNKLVYKCVTAHTATDFTLDINNWELLCGINEWTQNTTYKVGAIILHDGILYKVKTSFTSGSIFNDTNLEKIGGVGGAVVWQPETKYSESQLIIYDKLLYRATSDFVSGTTFSKSTLDQITIGWTAYWQPYTYYTVGETVVQANSILRCVVAHTSLAAYNTSEAVNWVMIASAQAIITYWTPNTQYTNGNAVIHNDILYVCNMTHTSSTDFVDDMIPGYEKWRTINTSATSGSWEQVTKLGVVAPKIIEVIINNTSAFCTSPVEVLKFRAGTQDETVNEFTFIAGDGQKFIIDDVRADMNRYVIFDGQVRLKVEHIYPMVLDTHTENGYINVSDEIDLSAFKVREDLVVR